MLKIWNTFLKFDFFFSSHKWYLGDHDFHAGQLMTLLQWSISVQYYKPLPTYWKFKNIMFMLIAVWPIKDLSTFYKTEFHSGGTNKYFSYKSMLASNF